MSKHLPIILGFMIACGQPSEEFSGPAEVFTSTVVELNSDGTITSRTDYVTHAQLAEEVHAREAAVANKRDTPGRPTEVDAKAQAISRDGGCTQESVWLWDNYGQTGNRLCLRGIGTADLDSYFRTNLCAVLEPRCWPMYWGRNVRSYWGGNAPGTFNGPGGLETYGIYTRVDNTGAGGWKGAFLATSLYLWW